MGLMTISIHDYESEELVNKNILKTIKICISNLFEGSFAPVSY
jgi:hypothetical protein